MLTPCQMPVVDGMQSAKMIRKFEKETLKENLSLASQVNGQVPIFAVSASLFEKDAPNYINTGFDGWIMKPIDFNRLNTLFNGLRHDNLRNDCTYQPGHWEKGGWFSSRGRP